MRNMYVNLSVMTVLSFISMYVLMYMMVDKFDNVYPNLNEFYMAAVMTAPMIILEILLMWSMYNNKKVNTIITGVGLVLFAVFFALLRNQTAITDKEFLKSMIPHHGGAILMCKNTTIQDTEIKELCQSITASQQKEIDWMKRKLDELEAK